MQWRITPFANLPEWGLFPIRASTLGHGFCGDIKRLMAARVRAGPPFLLASPARILYPVSASHPSGPGRNFRRASHHLQGNLT
jgi:hypothetical protein